MAACALYPVGSRVDATVASVESFGLVVRLDGTAVAGVLLAPEFDRAEFAAVKSGNLFVAGDSVTAFVVGHSEGRSQIDLSRQPPSHGQSHGEVPAG